MKVSAALPLALFSTWLTLSICAKDAFAEWPGHADTAFAPGGINSQVNDMARQVDGSWIIVGQFNHVGPFYRRGVARLYDDGSLDESFWEGLGGAVGSVHAVAVQNDGKILIGGRFHTVNGAPRNGIARLHADGSLDGSFGHGLAGLGGINFEVSVLALQTDGKILIAGRFSSVNGEARLNVARLHPDGSLDTTFGTAVSGTDAPVRTMALQPDGKVLLGGDFTDVAGVTRGRIARLHPSGLLDTAFGDGLAGANDRVNCLVLQPDGRILLAGNFTTINGQERPAIARLHPGGALDQSLWPDIAVAFGLSSLVLHEGRIIIAGSDNMVIEGMERGGIARLNHNGSLEVTFGLGMSGVSGINVMLGLGEEKIMIGGSFTSVHGLPIYRAARLHAGSPPPNQTPVDIHLSQNWVLENRPAETSVGHLAASDPDDFDAHTFSLISGSGDDGNSMFAIDGNVLKTAVVLHHQEQAAHSIRVRATDARGLSVEKILSIAVVQILPAAERPGAVDLSFYPGSAIDAPVLAVARENDGTWIIGGEFTTVSGAERSRVARVASDGTTVDSFMHGLAGANGTVHAVAIQQDGKILIGGNFTSVNGEPRNRIARLHADGSLDTEFSHGAQGANSTVHTIAIQGEHILIGGNFSQVNGVTRRGIARLDLNGSLDHSFQGDTRQSMTHGGPGPIYSIALQDDGRILVGGDFYTINGVSRNRIARLEADGTPDITFGNGLAGANAPVRAVALQPDGRILIGGSFTAINGASQRRVARLLQDGSRDSFSDWLPNGSVRVILVLSDGKIVIGGDFHSSFGPSFFGLIRLDQQGFRDTWGGSGTNATVFALAADSDGRVMVGGAFNIIQDGTRTRLARLTANGLVDRDFDNGPLGANGDVRALAVQPDGRVLVGGGFSRIHDVSRDGIARLHPDGTADDDFGKGLAGPNGWIYSIVVQPDGKILIAGGFTTVNGIPRGRVARLNADGTLDTTFGDGLHGANNIVLAMALQPDGRILIGGGFTTVNGVERKRVARLHPDGSVDRAFAEGLAGIDGGAATIVRALALQQDGNILVGGNFSSAHGVERNHVARLLSDGALDLEFGGAGGGPDHTIHAISAQPDGRILIGGQFSRVDNVTRSSLARLQQDGRLDETFVSDSIGTVYSLELMPDGKIIIAGTGLRRLLRDGRPDPTFHNPSNLTWVWALATQDDGKILAGGEFFFANQLPRGRLVRLLGGPPAQSPLEILLSRSEVAEYAAAGTPVGFLTAVDPDPAAFHTFSLVAGPGDEGNDLFSINGDMLMTAHALTAEDSPLSIRIRSTDNSGFYLERVFQISVTVSGYTSWAATFPEGKRAPADDPGGHGIPNLLRYAFGMDPVQPDRGKLPQLGTFAIAAETESPQALSESDADGVYLTLTYTRRTDDPSLLYIVEVSGDLFDWLPFEGVEEVTDDNNGETVTLIDSQPIDGTSTRFLRVRVAR